MAFINAYWGELILLASLAFNVATVIARITPTPKDDEIVSKIGKFLNFILLSSKNK